MLRFLGVDGIVFSRDFLHLAGKLGPEWKEVAEAPEGAAFHRDPPRFIAVKALGYLGDRPGIPLRQPTVRIIAERRNSVIVEITPDGAPDASENSPPAVAPIAFIRPYIKGYRAYFNGRPVAVREYFGMLPLVELPADARGILELRYRPPGLIHGLILLCASVAVMLLIAVLGRKRTAADQSALTSVEKT